MLHLGLVHFMKDELGEDSGKVLTFNSANSLIVPYFGVSTSLHSYLS